MGWLWSTAAPDPKAPDAPAAAVAAKEAAAATTASPASTSTAPPPASASKTTADDYDDPELRTFVAMLQSSAAAAAPTTPPSPASSTATTTTAAAAAAADPPIRERSLGDALLPTSMSCRQAFDLAWACQSPAGQWRAVYRHGSVQPCSQLWDDFWFCMRVRGGGGSSNSSSSDEPEDSRARAVREHYRTREIERYYAPGKPSSEDVWRSRTIDEVLPPGAVFQHAFQVAGDARGSSSSTQDNSEDNSSSSADAASRKDADQILADMERRRQIRRQIGYSN